MGIIFNRWGVSRVTEGSMERCSVRYQIHHQLRVKTNSNCSTQNSLVRNSFFNRTYSHQPTTTLLDGVIIDGTCQILVSAYEEAILV
jgi:hypothetical protein